jgi:hypothetical protein
MPSFVLYIYHMNIQPMQFHPRSHNPPYQISSQTPKPCSTMPNANAYLYSILHNRALTLLTLLQITIILLLPQPHTLSHHALHLNTLLALRMPPTQLLYKPTILVIRSNNPFPARNLDRAAFLWEMKLRQEDLRGRVLFRRGGRIEFKREGTVAQVESVGGDLADGVDGRGTHVGFGGAVAGGVGEFRRGISGSR